MIKILFIILVIYAIYKLVKGGYVSATTPSAAPSAASTGFVAAAASKAVSFLKSVF